MAKAKADNQKDDAFAYQQRALGLPRPRASLNDVCQALTLQSKNLRNTTHFAVNNVLTAYEWDAAAKASRLKTELHANQTNAIRRFNTAIDKINEKREEKYREDKAEFDAKPCDENGEPKKEPKLKRLSRLEATVTKLDYAVLDLTLLDNVLREWPEKSKAVYGRLPAKAAQQASRGNPPRGPSGGTVTPCGIPG